MADREKVMSWLESLAEPDWRDFHSDSEVQNIAKSALELLKEQDELLHKKQKDVDKLCNEISEWKHKYHDRPLKEQEAVPVIQREVMHMLVWCCGSCGVVITDGDKFCRMCGKQVKWE